MSAKFLHENCCLRVFRNTRAISTAAAGGFQHILVIVIPLPVPGLMDMYSCHPCGRYRLRFWLRLVLCLVVEMQAIPDTKHLLLPHLCLLMVILMLQC